jgi:hypothetical protein
MITSNRHPADELAGTRAQLRELKERESELRAELLERRGEDLLGETFAAVPCVQVRESLDIAAAKKRLGKALRPFLSKRSITQIRLVERVDEEGGHA